MRKVKGRKLRMAHWTDAVYSISIVLMCGEWSAALAWMNEQFEDVTEENTGAASGAKTVWIERDGGNALVLWFPMSFKATDGDDLATLAHECFHAAEMVLRNRGLKLSDESDEAYAYYVGYVFRECHKRLAK